MRSLRENPDPETLEEHRGLVADHAEVSLDAIGPPGVHALDDATELVGVESAAEPAVGRDYDDARPLHRSRH